MSSKNTETPVKKKKAAPKKQAASTKYKKEIAELKEQLENQKDKSLRLKAEFENFRKRKEKEIINLLTYEGETVVKLFLSVLDDMERLETALEDNKNPASKKLEEGLNLILTKIHKRFKELNVKPFAEPGETLDPDLHDALMMRQEEGKSENEILDVFEKGYRYKDRVIRHAKVVVNQTPS